MVYVCGSGQPTSCQVFQEHLAKVSSIDVQFVRAVDAFDVVIEIVVALSCPCCVTYLPFYHATMHRCYRFSSFKIFTLFF